MLVRKTYKFRLKTDPALEEKLFHCRACGHEEHADINAAKNRCQILHCYVLGRNYGR